MCGRELGLVFTWNSPSTVRPLVIAASSPLQSLRCLVLLLSVRLRSPCPAPFLESAFLLWVEQVLQGLQCLSPAH